MRGLTAVLLVLPVAMCVALSKNEIEEFTEYLWKTSALDQNLKDGTNVDQDEEEEVSDNAWEESGKFEGDLILNERQRRLIAEDVAEGLARNGLRDSTKRWPNNEVIFYIQREHFSGDQIQAIKEGIDDLSQASCIKFRPYKKGDRDAVVIQGSRRGCFSQVGYQGGYQVLNLSGRHPVGRGCFRHGTVVHELLHTLGFYHMQSSHDRDEFIDVVWANIVQPARHNFRKYNAFSVSDFGVGYDYDSVLHYSRRAFSANGGDTLVPKQSGARIGQRVGLSDKDTQKLNKMYCDADSNNSDAAAEEPAKQKNKKKTRNQPFQGHGIGYHQGKTVVIKLPVAETYKLPDSPSYAVFDYFSKAPQALPPTLVEGLGAGKEINYYRPPVSTFDTEKDHQFKTPKEPEKSLKDKPFIEKDAETKLPAAEGFFPSSDGSKNYQKQPSINIHKDSAKEPKVDSKDHKDLLQALERLDEIIKMHIYPSSKSYATELSDKIQDYSEFFKPATKEHESKESTKDELYNLKKSEPIESNKKDTIYPKNEKLNDTSNVNRTLFVSPLYSKNYGEVDSTFGTSLPIKNPGEKFSPQYSVLSSEDDEFAYVKSYDDYSRFYKPKGKSSSSESREPYSLLGDPVPLQEDWYRENYKKPAYDSPKKKLYQYGGNILESESVKDKALDNKEKFEDKESMSVPHEIKFSSEEDSSSIDSHPYNENSAEKMFDKYGHFGNSKTRRSDDSTEHYSPYYSYPEPRSGQMDGEDQRATLDYYNPLQKGYDWDETHEGIPTSKELNVKNRSSNDNKLIPVNEKPGEFKIKRLRKQSHSEMNNLIPKRKKTQSVSYRVTEEPEESESDDDYSSFERSMDDRLKTIVKNYEKVNNFDIQLPYDSHNESSESSEMMVKLNDSSHDVKLKTVSTEEKNK